MKLLFTYCVAEHDSDATISDGVNEARMQVWHVTDALGDLLRCVVQLLEGHEEVWCVWEDDPGEHKWTFHCSGELLRIRILRFPTSFSGYGAPDAWATVLFETTCALLKFATKVRNEVRRLLQEVGPEEYRRRLGHEFPQAYYQRLRQLIHQRQVA